MIYAVSAENAWRISFNANFDVVFTTGEWGGADGVSFDANTTGRNVELTVVDLGRVSPG